MRQRRPAATFGDIESGARQREEGEILLNMLDLVEREQAVTQRLIARELGIALGLANAYLKRCIQKGLIKVSEVPPRRYAYYLTPKGFAEKSRLTASYLSHSFSFFRRAREECAQLFAAAARRGHQRLALIGDGDLAEIASLVARDYPVEIVRVVAVGPEAAPLADAIAALGRVDAVVVTALVQPREAFDAGVAVLGAEHVYAPALLRLPGRVESTDTGAAA